MEQGTVFHGKYLLEEKLGEGTHKEVWLAYDAILEHKVVVKIICKTIPEEKKNRSDADKKAAFLSEARILTKFDRYQMKNEGVKYISRIYDANIDPATNLPFIVEEYIRGKTLQQVVEDKESFSLYELAFQLACAVEFVHEQDIVHNDIAPWNVMMADVVKLVDWGSARYAGDAVQPEGSRSYRAPEKNAGVFSPKSADVWSYGCVVKYASRDHMPLWCEGLLDKVLVPERRRWSADAVRKFLERHSQKK